MPIQITIRVDRAGNFVYDKAVQYVKRGQQVQWISENGNFVVSFGERSPFKFFEFRGRKGEATPTPGDAVLQIGALGVYRYAVAVSTEYGVFLDAFCPHIVVP